MADLDETYPVDGSSFFFAVSVGNVDGTIGSQEWLDARTKLSLDDAVKNGRHSIKEYGGTMVIFEARAVARLEERKSVQMTAIRPIQQPKKKKL